MAKSPYPGFTPLNNRRHELIKKKHYGGGLSKREECELAMLMGVVGLMVEYASPLGPSIARMEEVEKKANELLLEATKKLKWAKDQSGKGKWE